ncbi:hypothetical protein ACO0RG_003937 [Hanseniaspora osmophila]|uniref:Uncharacterized protein n=1 Tax=Hanseniaspora osmophila TaxID=56408 RepID=A0A1E5RAJ6_9ASCO|nr:hypothetical protein AWRI3579_g2573 [Hanseniaspora osmophila]
MSHRLYEFETVYLKQKLNESTLISENDSQVILELVSNNYKNGSTNTQRITKMYDSIKQHQMVVIPSHRVEIVIESNSQIDISKLVEFFTNLQYRVLDISTSHSAEELYTYKFDVQCLLSMQNYMKPYQTFPMNDDDKQEVGDIDNISSDNRLHANLVHFSVNLKYFSTASQCKNLNKRKTSMFHDFINSLIISNLEYSYPLCFNKIVRKQYDNVMKYQQYYSKLNINYFDLVIILISSKESTSFIKLLRGGDSEFLPLPLEI